MTDNDDTPDGFDKEAERRKLEEKYGDEAEQREDTQRMSELLLQGATMTNRHCDACGSPIFRQNGQEFCPTCNAATNGSAGEDGHQPDDRPDSQPTVSDRSPPADAQRTSDPNGSASPVGNARHDPRSASSTTATNAGDRAPPSDASDDDPRSSPTPADADASLEDARRTLIRALNSHAAAGATADDPRRARDHLAAAREAAETLAALR